MNIKILAKQNTLIVHYLDGEDVKTEKYFNQKLTPKIIDQINEKENVSNVTIAVSGLSQHINYLEKISTGLNCEFQLLSDLELFKNNYLKESELICILDEGSSFGIIKENEFYRYGGYGYLIGDVGSLYNLGMRLIKKYIVFNENELSNDFTNVVEDYFKLEEGQVDKFIGKIYTNEPFNILNFTRQMMELDNSTINEEINYFVDELLDYIYNISLKKSIEKIYITGEIVHNNIIYQSLDNLDHVTIIDEESSSIFNKVNISI